jgi:hypothetical protein
MTKQLALGLSDASPVISPTSLNSAFSSRYLTVKQTKRQAPKAKRQAP